MFLENIVHPPFLFKEMKAFDGGEVVGGSCDDVSRRPVPHVDSFLLPDKVPLFKVQNSERTKYITSSICQCCGSGIRCLINPCIRDLGFEIGKKSGSGSGMNKQDHISDSLETVFWVNILKFFDADPGWKSSDPG
jgi:hypothetical protein